MKCPHLLLAFSYNKTYNSDQSIRCKHNMCVYPDTLSKSITGFNFTSPKAVILIFKITKSEKGNLWKSIDIYAKIMNLITGLKKKVH